MGIKRWNLPQTTADTIENLAEASGLPWIVCAVLAARGICSVSELEALSAGGEKLSDPFLLKDMDKAAERILRAIESGERIAVYGDYDCDGITSTALLTSYLQSVGADVIYYVPSREREGYGLNNAAIEMLRGQKTDLIVTVDNGIASHDEIAFAHSIGVDVVVTDHHTPRETLPAAVAVINPRRHDDESPCKQLAGVGVAFKLVCALENAHPAELLEYYSDLVALGTIADVVPLKGENRIIVRHGIANITDNGRPGINALLEVAGLAGKELTSESVAFGIVPRINAAGRMGDVDDAIELLLTDDGAYAQEIAQVVDAQNAQRKKIEEAIFEEVERILGEDREILTKRVIVAAGDGWHHGVVGIVAAKLVDKYGKPCILLSRDGEMAVGSGRSLEGFSLIQAITACEKHLTRFGGHTLAAGLTLPVAAINAFDADLQAFARERYPQMPVALLNIDCVLPYERMDVAGIAALRLLEPFGAGNEPPLFLLENLRIDGVYPTSDKKHIRIRFSGGASQFYAVYFRMSGERFPYPPGSAVNVVASLSAGEYNGKPQLSVKIRDLRPFGVMQDQIIEGRESYACHLRGEYSPHIDFEGLVPNRDDFAVVYKFLRKAGFYRYGAIPLYYQLMGSGISYPRMLVALDVMEEMRLINREGKTKGIEIVPDPPKVDIDASRILSSLRAERQVAQGG